MAPSKKQITESKSPHKQTTVIPAKSRTGAPAQFNQSSRKGKKAWRKNVDIEDVESHLEEARDEERITGKPLHKTQDTELFQIDVEGDATIRKVLPRFSSSQLTAAKILAQRSAVPAVLSRSTNSKKRNFKLVTQEDKNRLLRIGKRMRRGPLNSYEDPTEIGKGSATMELSEAVKKSGTYDAWAEHEDDSLDNSVEPSRKKEARAPRHSNPRDIIELPAIDEPHQGMSYNPPAEAHQELLFKAHQAEEKRVQEAEKLAGVKNKMDAARTDAKDTPEGLPAGMVLDSIEESPQTDADQNKDAIVPPKKQPPRKTKQQRRKTEKQLAEKRALAEKAARKRMLVQIEAAKALRRSADNSLEARRETMQQRLAMRAEKLKRGLAGQKLGKHKVPEHDIEVQLGEDLSENLRALKPEGNLFRDRFRSLQRRALVEPRALVLPTKRKHKSKEYEKHAWKRFE